MHKYAADLNIQNKRVISGLLDYNCQRKCSMNSIDQQRVQKLCWKKTAYLFLCSFVYRCRQPALTSCDWSDLRVWSRTTCFHRGLDLDINSGEFSQPQFCSGSTQTGPNEEGDTWKTFIDWRLDQRQDPRGGKTQTQNVKLRLKCPSESENSGLETNNWSCCNKRCGLS